MKALLLGKNNEWGRAAAEFLRGCGWEVTAFLGERGQALPAAAQEWTGDWIFSYLCSWVVPEAVLKRANAGTLNFHPGPPEYPGTGCYNFALYDEVKEYGVTCHYMVREVDAGKIVQVVRFPVVEEDTVRSLQKKSVAALESVLNDVVATLGCGDPLPESSEVWQRKAYKRVELEALCEINPRMSVEEIKRRVRATRFPPFPGPRLSLAGFQFVLDEKEGEGS